MRSNVTPAPTENAPGHRGLSFRYRALLWLVLGIVLRLMTGSDWFLLAAAPAVTLLVVAGVGALIVLGQRGRKPVVSGNTEAPTSTSVFSAAEAV